MDPSAAQDLARVVAHAGAHRGRADVESDDRHRDLEGITWGNIPPMSETWEVLTVRGLAAVDERAEEFTGSLVIHRVGSAEPVEAITIRVKRSILAELHATVGRLLTRSTGLRRGGTAPGRLQ
jgi:hypothetical protein